MSLDKWEANEAFDRTVGVGTLLDAAVLGVKLAASSAPDQRLYTSYMSSSTPPSSYDAAALGVALEHARPLFAEFYTLAAKALRLADETLAFLNAGQTNNNAITEKCLRCPNRGPNPSAY